MRPAGVKSSVTAYICKCTCYSQAQICHPMYGASSFENGHSVLYTMNKQIYMHACSCMCSSTMIVLFFECGFSPSVHCQS